ncbi:MAG: hypothetical protein Q8M29_00650 [Bacteroidota bacterium]|nr:hypothetical protein [Bacteroidota bacterium]
MFKRISAYQPIYFLIGIILLLIPAFFNHFPFVYSDTGTYLTSGFGLILPEERPIFYGIFACLSSLYLSSWFIIAVQAGITFFLIVELLNLFLSDRRLALKLSCLIAGFVSIFSSAGIFSDLLLPDIFSAYLILSVAIIFIGEHKGFRKFLLYFIAFISLCVHVSNLYSLIVILILCFFMYLFNRKRTELSFVKTFSKKFFCLSGLLLFVFVSLSLVNLRSFKVFSPNASSHVFVIARYCESGLLKYMLEEEEKQGRIYSLTAFKDRLPSTAQGFIWQEDSPFKKCGGWQNSKIEFNKLINLSFSNMGYLKENVIQIFKGSIQQLYTFNSTKELFAYGKDLPPYKALEKYLPLDKSSFLTAKQNKGIIYDHWISKLHLVVAIISSFVCLVFLFFSKDQVKNKLLLLVLVFGIISNAIICGGFANVVDRLQARVIWIIPLFTAIFITSEIVKRLNNKVKS